MTFTPAVSGKACSSWQADVPSFPSIGFGWVSVQTNMLGTCCLLLRAFHTACASLHNACITFTCYITCSIHIRCAHNLCRMFHCCESLAEKIHTFNAALHIHRAAATRLAEIPAVPVCRECLAGHRLLRPTAAACQAAKTTYFQLHKQSRTANHVLTPALTATAAVCCLQARIALSQHR